MQPEFLSLAILTVFFAFAWLPASVGKTQAWGLGWLGSNRDTPPKRDIPLWANRCERAHNNLKENFPAFAVTVLLLGILGKCDSYTAAAATVFVIARLLHFAVYGVGLARSRSIAFFVGVLANAFLMAKIFI